MVNTSKTIYNVSSSPDRYSDLIKDVNSFTGGGIGFGLLLTVFLVTYFSLRSFQGLDALKTSVWVTWLTSLFLTLVDLVNPAVAILLFLVLLAVTGFMSKSRT